MRRAVPVLGVLAAAVLAGAGYLGWRLTREDETLEDARFRDRASELIVADLWGAEVRLFRAGSTLESAGEVALPAGRRAWLPAADYFIRAGVGRQVRWFPAPVAGYRQGPDAEGAVVISIRPPPPAAPPRLLAAPAGAVEIPAGPFLLGDRRDPGGVHYVWLAGFHLEPFEVTNGEFREFLADPSGYRDRSCWTEEGGQWADANATQCTAALRPGAADYARFGRDDQPVVWVNWYEANAFCAWITRKMGGGRWLFTLPTEAEWEKAARGPDGFDFALGNRISDAEAALYNWRKNPGAAETVCGVAATKARYQPNRYGLYHMTGNVAEWTQSVMRSYNRNNPWREDERNHDAAAGPRVCRGGSWYSASIATLMVAYRDSYQPQHSSQDLGFRVAAHMLP